jgi:DNA polymerase III, epsilon subunit
MGFKGQSHNSLEDARMTARIYEAFLESDESRLLLNSQTSLNSNPFGGLDLSQLFD